MNVAYQCHVFFLLKYVNNKYYNMKFVSYTKTDAYYEFVGENNEKVIIPATSVVLIDDESGAITVKNTGSRCVVGYLIK